MNYVIWDFYWGYMIVDAWELYWDDEILFGPATYYDCLDWIEGF